MTSMNKGIYKTDSFGDLGGGVGSAGAGGGIGSLITTNNRLRKTFSQDEAADDHDDDNNKLEISNFKYYHNPQQHQQRQQQQQMNRSYARNEFKGGTLERPKRLYNFSITSGGGNISSVGGGGSGVGTNQAYLDINGPETSAQQQLRRQEQKNYSSHLVSSSYAGTTSREAAKNKRAAVAAGNFYNEAPSTSSSFWNHHQQQQHQYEEPHLVMDYKNRKDKSSTASTAAAAALFSTARHDPSSKLSYLRRAESTTTVIPPSLLFAKSIKQTPYLKSNMTNEPAAAVAAAASAAANFLGNFEKDENNQILASMMSTLKSSCNNININNNTSSNTSPLLLYNNNNNKQQQQSDRAYHDDDDDEEEDLVYAPINDGAFNQMNNVEANGGNNNNNNNNSMTTTTGGGGGGGGSSAETNPLETMGTNLDETCLQQLHNHASRNMNTNTTAAMCMMPSTSSHSSSVMMHTYANPFQNYAGGGHGGGGGGRDSSQFSEDTTGPIIPDINTLRPSQLLKNSYSSSIPPPTLSHDASRNKSFLFPSVVATRLRSYFGLEAAGSAAKSSSSNVSKHRCSWRVSTFGLAALVIFMFLIILLLLASTRLLSSNEGGQGSRQYADKTKVPCIIVEESESTTSERADLSPPQPFEGDPLVSDQLSGHSTATVNCAKSPFLRNPLYFKELRLNQHQHQHQHSDPAYGMPITTRLHSFGSWSLWFSLVDSALVNFQFFIPSGTRLSLVANKNEPPSFTKHEVFQTIAEDVLFAQPGALSAPPPASIELRGRGHSATTSGEQKLVEMKYSHSFEHGSWYLTIINDHDRTVPVFINITAFGNLSTDCVNNCHNNGHCHLGRCQCFPGFVGADCADNVCPILCNGRGRYLQGGCRCEDGWKGGECGVRATECEVADCNGNGYCREGVCQCRDGFKGEHCELANCLDPECSGHGVCVEGSCLCQATWSGPNCSVPDARLAAYLPKCSQNGVFDLEAGHCICRPGYMGGDCSQPTCARHCGDHGRCQADRCHCDEGWSGAGCDHQQCDRRCLEHGRCANGTCHCMDGWMGEHCTLDGCPRMCSQHGHCVKVAAQLLEQLEQQSPSPSSSSSSRSPQAWQCRCDNGWGGHDCSAPQETNCVDEIDNDNDGLVDCADSECCGHEQCHQSLMCITSPDPFEVLARHRTAAAAVSSGFATFFQRVHFLIEDSSVQSYAQKDAFVPKRVSVIRGQVVGKELHPLIGIRVSVAADPQFGFTLSRSDGWFDILVNGGGLITLQFQRNPFHTIKKSIHVGWNELTVIPNPIIMATLPMAAGNGKAGHPSLGLPSPSLKYFSVLQSDFDDLLSVPAAHAAQMNRSNCGGHNREMIRPELDTFFAGQSRLTSNSEAVGCDRSQDSCILAESQSLVANIRVPDTQLHLVHDSRSAPGYHSLLHIRLTPAAVPSNLRFIFLRIIIEGQRYEKVFEAEANQKHVFAWNKQNVYGQKVYGSAVAKIYVGYIYHRCGKPHWHVLHKRLAGQHLDASEVGGWNVHIHHRYNVFDGVLQRGDGEMIDFRADDFELVAERVSGERLKARDYVCREQQCHGLAANVAKFFSLNALAAAPDGSLFVGDANLIRRIAPDGHIYTVYRFPNHSARQSYEYYLAFNPYDQYLYISDPQRYQIIKLPIAAADNNNNNGAITEPPEAEVVVGSGERCLPHNKNLCGDERPAQEARLIHPKGMAFGLDGSMFFADGNVIRMVDTTTATAGGGGVVRRVVGQWSRHQWVTPNSCHAHQVPANEIKLYWPTSVSINPLDGSLYFIDNYVLFQLTHDMRVSIVAGNPSFCAEEDKSVDEAAAVAGADKEAAEVDKAQECGTSRSAAAAARLVHAKLFRATAGEEIHFGSMAFDSIGQLYLADIARPGENRIFRLIDGGARLEHIAGLSSAAATRANCSTERCSTARGINCAACPVVLATKPSGDNAVRTGWNVNAQQQQQQQREKEEEVALETKLSSVTGLAVTGDGRLYVADDAQLALFAVHHYRPRVDNQLEIKIISPNLNQLYIFNKFGQHTSTRSLLSGRTMYTFQYNQENSFGHLVSVLDWLGNKLSLGRDVSGRVHTLVTPAGTKYQMSYSTASSNIDAPNNGGAHHHLGQLGSIAQHNVANQSLALIDYYPSGLIRAKLNGAGNGGGSGPNGGMTYYNYDATGRLVRAFQPNGAVYRVAETTAAPNNQFARDIRVHSKSSFDDKEDEEMELKIMASQLIAYIGHQRQQETSFAYGEQGRALVVNSSSLHNSRWLACVHGSASRLTASLLPTQTYLFPLLSAFSFHGTSRGSTNINNNRNNSLPSHQAAATIAMNYRLKMKSSIIYAVEKVIGEDIGDVIGDGNGGDDHSLVRIEYDWKANRQVYFNRSRPMLVVALDDHVGAPKQFTPNVNELAAGHHGSGGQTRSYSFKYNKAGSVTTDVRNNHDYSYDNERRLVKVIGAANGHTLYRYNDTESRNCPTTISLNNDKVYGFEYQSGQLKGVISPKGAKYQLVRRIVFAHLKYTLCPPPSDAKEDDYHSALNKTAVYNCYHAYYDERRRLAMRVWPSNSGKVVYRYDARRSMTKEVVTQGDHSIDQVIHGTGLIEHWHNRLTNQIVKGIARQGQIQFGINYKYSRDGASLKHQSCFFDRLDHVSKLSYTYQYDGAHRIRSIQAKLGSIALPSLDMSYSATDNSLIEAFGAFRYFERTENTSLVGDGVALCYRSYDRYRRILHQSFTIAEKEVVRIDYAYSGGGGHLVQTKTYMPHLGGGKTRYQNYSYNVDGLVSEVHDREHWRFAYDLEGNLVTLLYAGNRIDVELDLAGRVKGLRKGQQQQQPGQPQGHTPYVVDARGFVIQRGNEHLLYNNLGQLIKVTRAGSYEISYVYDHLERVVVRRDHRNNSTRQYFYGLPGKRAHLVTHFVDNADGRVVALIYDQGDSDETLMMVKVNNENFYIVCDQANSPIEVFDHRGQVVKEIHRSPWGHTLFDSNPAFHLPVDFHGAIHDATINLIHFVDRKRVYDTVVGRWLTPDHDWVHRENIFANPRLIHSQQFGDPINRGNRGSSRRNILSNNQITQLLHDETLSIFGGHRGRQAIPRPPLADDTPTLVKSASLLAFQYALDRLANIYTLDDNYFSLLSNNDWTTSKNTFDMISLKNSISIDGILLGLGTTQSTNISTTIEVLTTSYANAKLAHLVGRVLNGSHLLNVHLVISGVDHFYLVNQRPAAGDAELAQLKHLQRMLNVTVLEVYADKKNTKQTLEVQIIFESVILNIRYDSTPAAEMSRVIGLAKRFALVHKLNIERLNIFHNRPDLSADWSEDMRRFMLDNHPSTLLTSGASLPFRVEHFQASAEAALLEDSSNIVLRPK